MFLAIERSQFVNALIVQDASGAAILFIHVFTLSRQWREKPETATIENFVQKLFKINFLAILVSTATRSNWAAYNVINL